MDVEPGSEYYVSFDGVLYESGAQSEADTYAIALWPPRKLYVVGEGKTFVTKSDTELIREASVSKVAVAEGVVSIEAGAFEGCYDLASLTLPSTLTYIGDNAFLNCRALEEIFYHAVALEDLDQNNGVFEKAGHSGNGIRVVIGSEVKSIPSRLFYSDNFAERCPYLITVTFSKGSACQKIGVAAFAGCNDLTILFEDDRLPRELGASWYGEANYYLNTDTAVIFSDTMYVITLDGKAHLSKYLGEAESLDVPVTVNNAKLVSVGLYAFSEKTTLTSVFLPDSIESIGSYAFRNCPALVIAFRGNKLPAELGYCWYDQGNYYLNVNTIHQTSDALYTITQEGKAHLSKYLGSDESWEVPESVNSAEVVSIGRYAFANSDALLTVWLPDGLKSIGDYAFKNCPALTIAFRGKELPPSLGTSWNGYAGYFTGISQCLRIGDTVYAVDGDGKA